MFLTSAEPSGLSSCKDSKTFETDVNMSTFSTLSVLTEATIAAYKISIQIIFGHNLLFRNFKWNVVSFKYIAKYWPSPNGINWNDLVWYKRRSRSLTDSYTGQYQPLNTSDKAKPIICDTKGRSPPLLYIWLSWWQGHDKEAVYTIPNKMYGSNHGYGKPVVGQLIKLINFFLVLTSTLN